MAVFSICRRYKVRGEYKKHILQDRKKNNKQIYAKAFLFPPKKINYLNHYESKNNIGHDTKTAILSIPIIIRN